MRRWIQAARAKSLYISMIAVIFVTAIVLYGLHLHGNYRGIQEGIRISAARTIHPYVDDESVSEIGYIFGMRRETYISKGELNLVWFIAVPSANTRWSCRYQAGFPDFKVGDGVRIIHKKPAINAVDFSGYLIGLHDEERNKATSVWALDLDELDARGSE